MRTVTFKSVLEHVATRVLGAPDVMLQQEAEAFTRHINTAVRDCWERDFWPEWTLLEERFYRPAWDFSTEYALGDEVYFIDAAGAVAYYRALLVNQGQQPDESPLSWELAPGILRYITLDGSATPTVVTVPGLGATTLDALLVTVAQLKALAVTVGNLGTQRMVTDETNTYGTGIYRLDAGTDAEDVPAIYRPNNYVDGTNEVIWRKVN